MMRLFAGIAPPDSLKQRLALLTGGIPGARWVAAENYHITLRFFGDTSTAQAEDLLDALSRLEVPTMTLQPDGLDLFGERRRQQHLHIAFQPNPALSHLNRKIEQIAQSTGFEAEGRRFHPHITLARMRNPDRKRLQQFLIGNGDFRTPPFTANSFHLYESFLHSEGAIYTSLASFGAGE